MNADSLSPSPPSSHFPLPPSVDSMLLQICADQCQTPPDARVRRQLALLGEDISIRILTTISGSRIKKSLSAYIIHLAKDYTRVPTQEGVYQSSLVRSSSSCTSPLHSPNGISSLSPIAKRTLFSPPSSSESASSSTQRSSPHLLALSKLEFRKAFLILSYIGSKNLEDSLQADEILRWKGLPMRHFEAQVWNKLGNLGKSCCDETDRRKNLDWDSGKTHEYHCYVLQDGSYTFKGPYLSTTKTHLQRELGDENVLLVKFSEEAADSTDNMPNSSNYEGAFNKIAEEGILIGLRRYRFFVFKDGGKEETKKSPMSSSVKCYFVHMESAAPCDDYYILSNKTVWESRCMFMHVHMVSSMAKYMARFSLILSKTIKLQIDLASVQILEEEDIPCRDEDGNIVCDGDGDPMIHTDGTGFISEDLALKIPTDFSKAKFIKDENFERFLGRASCEKSLDSRVSDSQGREPIRLFNNGYAVKGTLLVSRKLLPGTIVIRPKMRKVEMDRRLSNAETLNSLEVVGISNKPRRCYLSRNLIALLTYGGVPKKCFMDILASALEDARTVCSNKRAALRVSLNYGEMDDFVVARMILCGIPLNEPCLQYRLSILANEEKKGLKNGKLPISESFYLMGTADPTGKLESNEVCVILDNGQISGTVLVYRNPGLHFGDIHILKATYVEEMEDIVGNAKFGIFFSTKGQRSVASEIANGDFDGDMYWVSRNPQLLSCFKASEPWSRVYSTPSASSIKPSVLSADKLEHELFRLFLRTRFQRSNCAGVAADSWLALMDRLLILGECCADEKKEMKKSMQQLVDLYYDALDAPKSGKKVVIPRELIVHKFPHYMERPSSYHSTSVLGHLYDMVNSYQSEDLQTDGVSVWKLPCLDVEIPAPCMNLWSERYYDYRHAMSEAMKSDQESNNGAPDALIQKYKQLLYGAPEFEDSPRNPEDIYNEARAIYKLCYDYAKGKCKVSYCYFAWRVAGPALCKLYAANKSEKNEKLIICSPSVLREVLN